MEETFSVYLRPTGPSFYLPTRSLETVYEITTLRLNICYNRLANGLDFLLASSLLITNPFLLICVSPRGLDLPVMPWHLDSLAATWHLLNPTYCVSQFLFRFITWLSSVKSLVKQLYSSNNKRNIYSQHTEGYAQLGNNCCAHTHTHQTKRKHRNFVHF